MKPRKPNPATAALVVSAALVACAHRGVTESPFVVPPDSLFGRIKTVAVSPATVAGDLEIADDALARLEAGVEEGLEQAGFSVIPAHEYIGIWQHIADGYGGFYDTRTGKRDDESYRSAIEQLRVELRERYEADGIFFPELWDGSAPFEYGVAKWDGASHTVFGAGGLSGEVRAMTLVVVIEDLAGIELFTHGFAFATMDAWHNNDWLPLALDEVVGDSKLVARAVAGVLAPLVEFKRSG